MDDPSGVEDVEGPASGPREMTYMDKLLIVVAGDSGVYSGWAEGGVRALGADGRVVLADARHLRRYSVVGRAGTGSAGDLAVHGLDPSSASIGVPVPGESVLLGVRRAFTVAPGAVASFAP